MCMLMKCELNAYYAGKAISVKEATHKKALQEYLSIQRNKHFHGYIKPTVAEVLYVPHEC